MNQAIAVLLVLFAFTDGLHARYNDINYAVNLSGGAYISVPFHSSLNSELAMAGRFTIDAWVKPAAIGSEMAIVGNNYAYWFGLDATGRLKVRFFNQLSFSGTGVVSTSAWTHVAVAFDNFAGTLRFYINGTLDRLITHAGTIASGTGALAIGADIGGAGAPVVLTPWNGALDEVRIWKHAINFSTALGALTRTAHGVRWGLYGQYLVSAWRLNGGYLDHCGGNHGTLVGSATFSTTPLPPFYERIGLSFTNNLPVAAGFSVATVPHSASLDLTTNYTIEFWIKPSSQGGNGTYQMIITKGPADGSQSSFWIALHKPTGKIRFSALGLFSGSLQESASPLALNQWSHVAISYGPDNQIYRSTIVINGIVDQVWTWTGQATASNREGMLIGAGSLNSTVNYVYGFSGILDEMRIWNVTRTPAEIADNHRLELAVPQTGLVANYHFDGEIRDWSGYNNHSNDLIQDSWNYFVSTTDLPGFPSLVITEPAANAVWNIGESRNIGYQAAGLPWVKLELSRDGGATFGEILTPATNGPIGYFTWPVTGPPSTQCRIRASTPTPTPLADTSELFTIAEILPELNVDPMQVQFVATRNGPLPPTAALHIWNSAGGTLNWNISTNAPGWLSVSSLSGSGNDQIIELGITTTDMFPGVYTETLTVRGNAANGPFSVLVTYRVTTAGVWTLSGRVKFNDTLGFRNVPVHAEGVVSRLVWTGDEGPYAFENLPGGDYTIFPRSRYFRFNPTQRMFTPLNNNENGVDFEATRIDTAMMFHYSQGWNLVSIPVSIARKPVTEVFPDAVPPAYIFDLDSGYVPQTTIEHLHAYWIRFPRTDSVRVSGIMFRKGAVLADTRVSGWNTLAMPSGDVLADSIVESPAGALIRIYEYDPVNGYVEPAGGRLRSGKGYFVKLIAPGGIEYWAMEEEEEPATLPPASAPPHRAPAPPGDMPPPPPIMR
jgi:hypothetical protein